MWMMMLYHLHRGMMEVYSSAQKDQTVWQPRPTDVELETEFLRRLMVKLGSSETQAKAAVASAPPPAMARLVTVDNLPTLQLDDGFDNAWRRVGLTLDRTGFAVEDRNRTQGIYFVRYVPTQATEKTETGFFGRLFGGAAPAAAVPAKYQVLVRSSGNSSTVSVLDEKGQAATTANAQNILQLLLTELK
jgi:outer membrane protein assembly factor BamC